MKGLYEVLNEQKGPLLEEHNHTFAERLKLNSRYHALKSSEAVRNAFVAKLETVTRLYKALVAKEAGSSSSTSVRGFVSSVRADL